jgi:hypothetical protein
MTGDSENNKIKKSYSKKEKYGDKQIEVVNRLNEILGINENNNKFILEELKNDEDKQGKIIGLEEDIKRYFAYNRWPYFNSKVNKEALSLMRSIYKSGGYDINYKKKTINGELKTIYTITKNL